jgi:hypothetical protein
VGPPETAASDAWGEVQKSLDKVLRFYNNARKAPDAARSEAKESMDAAQELLKNAPMLGTFGIKDFSVCMGAAPHSDGFFTWSDDYAVQKPNIFTKIPVLGKHTWSVSLKNVKLMRPGGFKQQALGCEDKECSALVDTGTSLLAVPYSVVNKITEVVQQAGSDCSNIGSLPNLVFEMGGQMLSLPPDAYLAEVGGEVPQHMQSFVRIRNLTVGDRNSQRSECKVVLMESYLDAASGPIWIFGMPFFRKYYTNFHLGSGHKSRAIYVAEANADCLPIEGASLARSRPHHRRLDVSKVRSPLMLRRPGFKNL